MKKVWLVFMVAISLIWQPYAFGCQGGFFASYPRKIVLEKTDSGLTARVLEVQGTKWLIPIPEGLFDLETLNNEALPDHEAFRGLAFSLMPWKVCFTDYAGDGAWPENRVPVELCILIDKSSDMRKSSLEPGVSSALPPAVFGELQGFLQGKHSSLSAGVLQEINDRPTLELLLFSTVPASGDSKELTVEYNINQGVSLNDSLQIRYCHTFDDLYVMVTYAVPLEKQWLTPERFGMRLKDLEGQVSHFVNLLSDINGLDLKIMSW